LGREGLEGEGKEKVFLKLLAESVQRGFLGG